MTYVTTSQILIGIILVIIYIVYRRSLPSLKTFLTIFLYGQLLVSGFISLGYGLDIIQLQIIEDFKYVVAFGGIAIIYFIIEEYLEDLKNKF